MIRETGNVYQVCSTYEKILQYEDYKHYLQARQFDELITIFAAKEPVHRIIKEGDKTYIERLKTPRFNALYLPDNELTNLQDITWLDAEPPPQKSIKVLRNAREFLRANLKH